jgi:hypothetical protein
MARAASRLAAAYTVSETRTAPPASAIIERIGA